MKSHTPVERPDRPVVHIAPPRGMRKPRQNLLYRIGLYRIGRMGGKRQILLLPFLVVKIAAGDQVDHLQREIDNARAAAQTPFWSGLVALPRRVGRHTSVMRRYATIAPKHYRAICDVVEDRLEVAVGCARRPAGALIAGNHVLAALPGRDRARVHAALTGVTLPRTPMHGDLHMFNFCKARDGFVLIDWEDYAEDGSFVLDYVDFHVQNSFFAQEALWFPFLAGLDTPDPSAVWAADRLGIAPDLLWLLFMLVKLENMALRYGGLDAMPVADRAAYLDVARAQVAAALPVPAPGSSRQVS